MLTCMQHAEPSLIYCCPDQRERQRTFSHGRHVVISHYLKIMRNKPFIFSEYLLPQITLCDMLLYNVNWLSLGMHKTELFILSALSVEKYP